MVKLFQVGEIMHFFASRGILSVEVSIKNAKFFKGSTLFLVQAQGNPLKGEER